MTTVYLTVEQVLRTHHELMLDERQRAILVDAHKLESAVLRPQAEAFGEERFPALAEKAAALLQGVAVAHPFMDGNKRAGLGAMLMLIDMNGVRDVADHDTSTTCARLTGARYLVSAHRRRRRRDGFPSLR